VKASNNKVLIDLKKHARHFDNLARALDGPRGPGRIRQAQRCFAELTESLRKDAQRRGCYSKQLSLF
jgi:hypothetical protein